MFMMKRTLIPQLAAVFVSCAALPGQAQQPPQGVVATPLPSYADYAGLVLAAPIIADATIKSAARIDARRDSSIPAGMARFYVTADITALIRGAGGLPSRIGYVADVPLDSRGKAPKLNKLRVLLFARPAPARPGEVQLVRGDAQRSWTPGADQRVRDIIRAVLAENSPPEIMGLGNAFHVPGSLPGESETQIFLLTADNRPVSLSVLSRPGEAKKWSVALGEIVDEAAATPQRDTLLWYRLACSLPPELPDRSLASARAGEAEAARTDYRFVIESLGRCDYPAAKPAGAGPE
jgi:hypothetical protein